MKFDSEKMNDFKAKFIENCKKPTTRIVIIVFLLCVVSVAYLLINRIKANYETIPNTYTIYDGKDIKLKANYKLNGKVTYDVYNLTSYEVDTGTECILQKKSMGKWKTLIPDNKLYHMIGYTIPSNESKEFLYDSTFEYGNLPVGKYRIVKIVATRGKNIYVAGKFRVIVPGLKQQISKKEAAQVVQDQAHIDDFDNTIIEKVTYEGKRVYKVTFQTKIGEYVKSDVWYVDKGGRIVGND